MHDYFEISNDGLKRCGLNIEPVLIVHILIYDLCVLTASLMEGVCIVTSIHTCRSGSGLPGNVQ